MSELSSISSNAVGKPNWSSMLQYLARLHQNSTYATDGAFPYDWESIGTGYCCGLAFGHWDIIHEVLDHIPENPQFACKQIINDLYHQRSDGFLPGSIWIKDDGADYSDIFGHPPLWIYAVDEYYRRYESGEFVIAVLPNLLRQISWFENNRKADDGGYFYLDILTHEWESGIDEGVRFKQVQQGKKACIDATSHVYAMYESAARWLSIAGQSNDQYVQKAQSLKEFIATQLYSHESGFFHDIWSVNDAKYRVRCFDGFWPLICGAATPEQATELIENNLLNEERFLCEHPVPTVALCEPDFEHRMWRGPSWNSMTYWIARGCARYGRADVAAMLLEKALDATAIQFERTGTIWEYYHCGLGDQKTVERKPDTSRNMPSCDYLGHNPLIAMAYLYMECREVS
ncbi:trehalase family glycosidase [Ruficoccus sp. ZRK36]|uniref:MGH1-like glycoside hydrolase domain-containing protein n=1 Tax=Ruficoccus sp. ZRK36 TaxID=2866311 RepID=UPI001C73AD63|nr:trehalase family glycosidase [Ruficoccus sp. ZRK36]QYY37247.1 hypothetical protein K0V07_07125 [Ruficoccus sp. ZRK36]